MRQARRGWSWSGGRRPVSCSPGGAHGGRAVAPGPRWDRAAGRKAVGRAVGPAVAGSCPLEPAHRPIDVDRWAQPGTGCKRHDVAPRQALGRHQGTDQRAEAGPSRRRPVQLAKSDLRRLQAHRDVVVRDRRRDQHLERHTVPIPSRDTPSGTCHAASSARRASADEQPQARWRDVPAVTDLRPGSFVARTDHVTGARRLEVDEPGLADAPVGHEPQHDAAGRRCARVTSNRAPCR